MLGVGCFMNIYMRIGLTQSLQEITEEGSTANTVTRCFVASWELNYSDSGAAYSKCSPHFEDRFNFSFGCC